MLGETATVREVFERIIATTTSTGPPREQGVATGDVGASTTRRGKHGALRTRQRLPRVVALSFAGERCSTPGSDETEICSQIQLLVNAAACQSPVDGTRNTERTTTFLEGPLP